MTPSPAIETLSTAELQALDDVRLMQRQRDLAAVRRRVDAESAAVAGELARRSAREFGYGGLAQRLGARTPERLVAELTGVSSAEARALVAVGTAGDVEWMAAVTASVEGGQVGVGAAAAIRAGLGQPTADVDEVALADAAGRLATEAVGMTPEQAATRARRARDELDAARVLDRERVMRERRFLRLIPQADGMTRITGLLDPENAALVADAVDRVTAPRRGGVRFVDPAEHARVRAIEADPRSTEQLALDALVQMIRLAAAVDDGTVFGVKAPAVRVHVALADLRAGEGVAELEGQSASISVRSAERIACSGGSVPVLFDEAGRGIDLGRSQRLHSPRQRVVIAARDGGCLAPGCDRPPSWCEVHHIVPWDSGGGTSVDDGVLLCRHHHMWLHDTGRRIVRDGGRYLLQRADGSPPVELESKGGLHRRAVEGVRVA